MCNLTDEIKVYINYTKEYGKPSKDVLDYFLNGEIVNTIIAGNSKIIHSINEKYLNELWTKLVINSREQVGPYDINYTSSGGYDFYKYLIMHEPKTREQVKQLILKYEVPKIPDVLISIKDLLVEYASNDLYLIKYPDNTYKLLAVLNESNVEVIDTDNIEHRRKIHLASIDSTIQSLSYRYIYTGTDTNRFVGIASNSLSSVILYITINKLDNNSNNVKQSYRKIDSVKHSETSDWSKVASASGSSDNSVEASVADELTESGITKLIDKLAVEITTTRQDILDSIEEKIAEKQLERKLQYNLSKYSGEYKTLDIYDDKIMDTAINTLINNGRLLITGGTGDGKTELAYLLAHEFTDEPIGKPLTIEDNGCYNRICVVNARNGFSLTSEDKTGILDKFVNHIKENNITDTCVLICNEIQASDMGYILGDSLWENFNNSGITNLLPSNLYLIFTGCNDRDFGIDSQVTQRISTVELSYLSKQSTVVNEKLTSIFKDTNNFDKILDLVEQINDSEEYAVITVRKFLDAMENNRIELNVDDALLSSHSRNLKERLLGLFE